MIIAFSGGCFSGKTSTINLYKNLLGDRAITLDELVRGKKIISIDDIRKDPIKYLDFQEEIITQKIEQEKYAFSNSKDKIVLVDRALSDSLFYLTFYVNKDKNLQGNFWTKYSSLIDRVKKSTQYAFENIYDYVLEFSPIEAKCNDEVFRPHFIDVQKYIEYDMISTYNQAFSKPNQLIKLNLNKNVNEIGYDKIFNEQINV